MLERVAAENGVVFYRSPLLAERGVPHAFSTRLGGVSPAPFDSLNLGNPGGSESKDSADNLAANYARLEDACGCSARERCRVHQVHGNRVIEAIPGQPFDFDAQADAIITADPARSACVRVADCVPILLAGDSGRIVAAVHAGWRGVIAGVLPAAIERLRQLRCDVSRMIVAIGPCIGAGAFEVGPEVLAAFRKHFGQKTSAADLPSIFNGMGGMGTYKRPQSSPTSAPPGKGHVDLCAAVCLQALRSGIDESHIDLTDRCTFRDRDEFFSHRRDHGVTGRMAAIIAPLMS